MVLESEQQLIIATKPTKKHEKVILFWCDLVVFVAKLSIPEFLKKYLYYSHETLFLFSCDFVGFVANNTP